MKSWQLAVVGLACLALAGCQTDPNIALLERELRFQEDEIYRLRDVVEDYQAALKSCREGGLVPGGSTAAGGEPAGLLDMIRPEGIPSVSEEIGPSRDAGTRGDRRSVAPPSPYGDIPGTAPEDPLGDGPGPDQPGQDPSGIKLPVPDPSDGTNVGDAPEVRLTSVAEPILTVDSRHVTQLVLNRRLTGGYDRDGRPGDEGIVVAIQALDAQGRRVAAPADMSVVVLDPALEGEAARVARWDFAAAEFPETVTGREVHLEMSWPADPPIHSRLYLFARYTTSDGRELQAEGPIQITLPGQVSGRWVSSHPPAPTLPTPQPSRPEPGVRLSEVRLPEVPSPPTRAKPPEPKIARPVWSPERG